MTASHKALSYKHHG